MFDYRVGPPPIGWRYYTDFVWLPATAGLVAWLDRAAWGWGWGAWLFAGFVLFTLVEYVVHRWLLHGPLWNAAVLKGEDHQHHHSHPQQRVVFPWWYTPALFGLAWLALGSWCPPLFAGFALGGMWFFTVHHAIHHWDLDRVTYPVGVCADGVNTFPHWLKRYGQWHDLHHKDLPANYGITHPWWDLLFGTYMTEAEGRVELERLAADRQLSKPWTVDRDARVRLPDRRVILRARGKFRKQPSD